MDAALLEKLHQRPCTGSLGRDDLLIIPKEQVNIPLRLKALLQQRFHRLHHGDQVVFHIQRATAPDELPIVITLIGRMRPVVFRPILHGDNILMGQHSNRVKRCVLPLPAVEQVGGRHHFAGELLMDQRVSFSQKQMEPLKLRPIHILLIRIGYRRNPDGL